MPKIEKPCSTCQKAPVAKYLSAWKLQPRGYCSPECRSVARRNQRGARNPCWRGGRYVEPGKGYILLRMPSHHRSRQNGYVLEHLVVMEEKLGRRLKKGEVVHHLNHDPADNRPENLHVFASNGEHLRAGGHHRKRQPPCRCGRLAVAKGLCGRHYAQKSRTGKTWGYGTD